MNRIFSISLTILFVMFISPLAPAQTYVDGTYLYTLSNFNGVIPYNWTRLFVDREKTEIYVLYGNIVTIFNEAGMEIHRFGQDMDIGQLIDLTLDSDGNILLLIFKNSQFSILKCDYRGEPLGEIGFKNLPKEFSNVGYSNMVRRGEKLYFGSSLNFKVIITDMEGNFIDGIDLLRLIEMEEKDIPNMEIGGFSIDREGNLLFTIPVLFKAFRISPDKRVEIFGKAGSSPGKFNIVTGIIADNQGNILIVDRLKCAVMVYDKNFQFINQFGYRGLGPGGLIAPTEIAIDNVDRIYVTQGRRRGISVFKLTYK